MNVTTATKVIARATRDISALDELGRMDRYRLAQLRLIEYVTIKGKYRVTLRGKNAITRGWLDTCFECGGVIVIESEDEPSSCPSTRCR